MLQENQKVREIIQKRRQFRNDALNQKEDIAWKAMLVPEFRKLDTEIRQLIKEIATAEFLKKNTKSKEDLLAKHIKLRDSYLEKMQGKKVPSGCSLCDNNGTLKDRVCNCVIAEYVNGLDWAKGIDDLDDEKLCEIWRKQGDNIHAHYSKIFTHLTTYANKFPKVKKPNMLLLGKTGTGKTYAAKVLATRLLKRELDVAFVTSYDIIERIKQNIFDRDGRGWHEILRADVLIIDDLGTEPIIKNVSEEGLYNLINQRLLSGKPFIITSNLGREDFFDRYDQRITSRIFAQDTTNVLEFKGFDLRIN